MTIEHIKPCINLPHNRLINYGLGGSRAYGIHTELSDYDYGGIYIRDPKSHFCNPYLGYPKNFKFKDDNIDREGIIYEYTNAINLIYGCNPNMLELLWRDEEDNIYSDVINQILISFRHKLISKKAKHTFSGYAHSQFKRIKGHNKWINNPQPKEQPVLEDFPIHILLAGEKTQNGFDRAKYKESKAKWKQYWEWKNNRNEARALLEEKNGYDTKHASHLIRLMTMGIEILETGIVQVKRHDANHLLEIRDGKYTYEELSEMFLELDNILNLLYDSSSLQSKINPQDVVDMNKLVWEAYHDKTGSSS